MSMLSEIRILNSTQFFSRDDSQVWLEVQPVEMFFLRKLGIMLSLGTVPIRYRLYYALKNITGLYELWITELCNKPDRFGEVIGIGDGYYIQRIRVDYIKGVRLTGCDAKLLDLHAKKYASVENGNLNGTDCTDNRWFYDEPCGYGGPMYDRCTSNTYASWLIGKSGGKVPEKPKGGIGWGEIPKFPGPARV